ncbi:MAG: hypothetical protein AAGE52_34395, partial [Myxococcota bacterium]
LILLTSRDPVEAGRNRPQESNRGGFSSQPDFIDIAQEAGRNRLGRRRTSVFLRCKKPPWFQQVGPVSDLGSA